MPLFSTKEIDSNRSLLLWKIDETEEQLRSGIIMHPSDAKKFSRFTHENKRKEFLALRCCLREYFGTNPEVYYTAEGKPYLENGHQISFSHSRQYAGMIVGKGPEVGIDIEMYRQGILRIAPKFLREEEKRSISENTQVEHITHYWGAKEVMVKITGDRRLNFIKELEVQPFQYSQPAQSSGTIRTGEYQKDVKFYFEKFEDLFVTYGWEAHPQKV